jgi:hypothetical protein
MAQQIAVVPAFATKMQTKIILQVPLASSSSVSQHVDLCSVVLNMALTMAYWKECLLAGRPLDAPEAAGAVLMTCCLLHGVTLVCSGGR